MFEYSGEWNYFWLQKNSLEARQDGTRRIWINYVPTLLWKRLKRCCVVEEMVGFKWMEAGGSLLLNYRWTRNIKHQQQQRHLLRLNYSAITFPFGKIDINPISQKIIWNLRYQNVTDLLLPCQVNQFKDYSPSPTVVLKYEQLLFVSLF